MPRTSGARAFAAPRAAPRTFGNGSFRGGAQAAPRSFGGARYGAGHNWAERGGGGYFGRPGRIRPYFSHDYVRPFGWRPYYPYHFIRPYYAFSPWLDLGFGVWCGFPVPYPWVYLGDYEPTVFGVEVGGYAVAPARSTYGGVSFDIQPSNANLFVDGQYVGVVGSFGPSNEPLTLEPGSHQIAIQLDGYRPLEFDVTVGAGQVIPYRGALEPQ